MMNFDVEKIRAQFPMFAGKDKPLIYLDNAATTQKPQSVIDAVTKYYSEYSANVHRGIYAISEKATHEYESARTRIAKFIGADFEKSIVFTRGATEAINLVAYAWARYNLNPGDEILITEMEHHSNIIPWQLAARDTGATLRYIPIDETGTLVESEKYINPKTKLFAITQQSNVFGTTNPVKELTEIAHSFGAKVLVDAAQAMPHLMVDVVALDCDFLAISGHKMLAPTGVGALFAKQEILEEMEPFLGGGEMIEQVTMETATWSEIPQKFEAGTPNIAQAIGFGAAVDFINQIGIEKIKDYEGEMTRYAIAKLSEISGMQIYGDLFCRGPVISFNVSGVHSHDLAQLLDMENIAIRAGHHCAQPIMRKLDVPATARASFYLYNTKAEVDALCEAIEKAKWFLATD